MTLNQIVDDILRTCYYADKDKSERIARRQVEAWVHQYRLLLLKQEISKNSVVDPTYITYMNVDMKQVPTLDEVKGGLITTSAPMQQYPYDSVEDLPEMAPLIGRVGITSVLVYGEKIPMTPITVGDIARSLFGSYDHSWGKKQMVASLYGKKLRITKFDKQFVAGDDAPTTGVCLAVKCGIILANPSDITQTIGGENVRENEYPIPIDRIPRLKQMIFSSELQWLFPGRDTAQAAQMAKLEEQELHNNPTALMQAGADLYDGFQ